MMNVDRIMTTEVLTLSPSMSLRAAVEELSGAGVSGAPVVEGSRLVGVVSTTDLMEFQGTSPALNSPNDEPASLRDELERRRWDDSERSEDPSSYFVDLWGASGPDAYQRLAASDSPAWDLLARHTVGEVMTRSIIGLEPDRSLRAAARLMTERGVHRVLITRDDALVGIVTTMDLVRAIADGAFGESEPGDPVSQSGEDG